MNREIKFKVLSRKRGQEKWEHVGFERINEFGDWENEKYINNSSTWLSGIFSDITGQVQFKRLQFTGREDIKNKEIYEGDRLLSSMPCDFEEKHEYIVGFDNGAFVFYRSNTDQYPARQWNDGTNDWYSIENTYSFETEITGNIHYYDPDLISCE